MHLEAEYILVCAKSQDNTREVALKLIKQYPKMDIVYVEQKSNGKANGVFEGITFAKGDVLAILDSDISVDPEKLFDFFEIIENNSADFVNGTRMIYPMEKKAMRFLNKIGNKTFQYIISKVIFQDLSDSLCGTKVFKKTNIESLLSWRYNQKVIDPFADFDLIFSSAYHGLKIAELPVHYKARVYGTTQISRFRDGYKLLVYFLYSFYLFNVSKYSK
jgi:glycosyltransferase involved in cell wall biosynthesis